MPARRTLTKDQMRRLKEHAGLKVGDVVPMPPAPKLEIKPAFTGSGTTSFKPARKHKR